MDSQPDSLMTIQNSARLDDSLLLDEDESTPTPAQVLAEMRIAWQNEIASPTLLPHKFPVTECLVDQVEGMEENLGNCRDKTLLKISVHRMELHRITYLVNDYLRLRLSKIEENPRWLLREHERRVKEDLPELLADQEIQFARRYATAEARLMGNNFLSRLPQALRKIPVPEPNLECERVYAQVLEEGVEDVTVPDYQDRTAELIVGLEKDSVHLIAYNSVQEHLENGRVRLL